LSTTHAVPTYTDLRQIKGLGPRKAEAIQETLESVEDLSKVTKTDLADIQGVSEALAEQVIRLVRGQSVAPAKRAPRKRTRKATARKASTATTNGSEPSNLATDESRSITLTAGFLRKAANQLAEEGNQLEAQRLRNSVSDLLDHDVVPFSRIS
jgi:NAD-dependent DNA ligase